MASPVESSTHLTDAEEAFAAFLACQEESGTAFEEFCRRHPELAPQLQRLYARWRVFDEAVSADLRPSGGGPRGDAAAADHLLARLHRTRTEDPRYESSAEIGRGGMGRILEVWDRDLRRSLAMKVLQERGKRDPRSLARFLDEAWLTGQLEHPGIVPVHELGLDAEGRVYFTMPLVRGEDLQQIFERAKRGDPAWSQARALEILLRVCEAVGYAHARGVVHRDLKPANVMVGAFGETYVMDWGLARILARDEREDGLRSVRDETVGDAHLSALTTMEGDVVGTPAYMAPEQARGAVEDVGPASDVYSIGAMLYQLLTGSKPYLPPGDARSSDTVLRDVQSRAPLAVHALAPDVPPELEAICEKAMARAPSERYPGTMELAADLRAFLEQRVVAAYETGAAAELRKWIARNRRLAVSIGAGLVALLAGLALSATQYVAAKANERAALDEKARADANAGRLAVELRRSRLAEGRLTAAAGNHEQAEELLWRAHLTQPNDPLSRWRLWELYARFPRLRAAPAPARADDLALSPDGSLVIVAGGAGGTSGSELVLFDSASLEVSARIPVGAGKQRLALDATGRRALVAGRDGRVALWDLQTSERVAAFDTQPSGVADVVHYAPTERWVLGDDEGSLRVLDAAGLTVAVLASPAPVSAVAAAPGGAHLASGHTDGSVRLWRPFESTPRAVWDAHFREILRLDFTPDGARLFVVSNDHCATEWEVATGRRLNRYAPENGALHGLDVGPDEKVAVGGWYRTDLVDGGTGERLKSLFAPAGVKDLGRSARERLTVLHPGLLVNWDLETDRQRLRIRGLRGWLAATGAAGTWAFGDRRGIVRIHDGGTGAVVRSWREEQAVGGLAMAPDGRSLAVLAGGEVRVRDLRSAAVRSSFAGGGGASAAHLAFSPDGALLASTVPGETPFELRRADDGTRVAALGRPGEQALALCFAPTGDFVATTTRTGSRRRGWQHWLSTWSLHGEELTRWRARWAWKLAVSPDGARIAAGQWGRDPEIWELATQKRVAVLRGHTAKAWAVDWHPSDPNLLASCSDDGTLRLWSADLGEELLAIEVGAQLTWLRFGPTGETLAACGSGDDAVVWDLTYFDRHIAGNAAYRIASLREELGEDLDASATTQWVDAVQARAWPRFGR